MMKAYLGISPFNPYYTKSRILQHYQWALENNYDLHFLIGGSVYVYTLIGLKGEEPSVAIEKMKNICDDIERSIYRSTGISSDNKKVIKWKCLEGLSFYEQLLSKAKKTYEDSPEFRSICKEQIIKNLGHRDIDADNKFLTTYLLNEIAGLIAMSESLDIHVEIYPGEDLFILDEIYNGKFQQEFSELIQKRKREFINLRFQ